MGILSIGTALGAGFLASLSPCIYPMLPITIGYLTKQSEANPKNNKKLKVISFFLGQVFAFTTLGIVAVKAGEIFGFSSESFGINLFIGLLLMIFALSTLERFQPIFSKLSNLLPQKQFKEINYMSAFIFGALSALVASPCTSPVLGGILSKIAAEGSLFSGVAQMAAFSIGMSIIFLILGLGFINANKIPRSGNWMIVVHKITVGLLVLSSLWYLFRSYEVYS